MTCHRWKLIMLLYSVHGLILLIYFSDPDRGVRLYSYWGLELVNRSRYTEGRCE